MTLSAHGGPLARQPHVSPMRISVSNAAACRTAARPSGSQRPAGRSRLDFSLIDVCHPYRTFLSTTLLSVLGREKLRGACAECGAWPRKPSASRSTWRHFVGSCTAHRDTRAIRLLPRRERGRGHSNEERESRAFFAHSTSVCICAFRISHADLADSYRYDSRPRRLSVPSG